MPTLPKQERPAREGARVASVETGLAAAAAKLAQQVSWGPKYWFNGLDMEQGAQCVILDEQKLLLLSQLKILAFISSVDYNSGAAEAC